MLACAFRDIWPLVMFLSPGQTDSQVVASWKLGSPCDSVWPGLACTCVDLRWLWSRSNFHASQYKFFTVWPPNATLFASSTCRYLRLLANQFDQGLRNRKHFPCFYRVIETREEVWENEKCCGNTNRSHSFFEFSQTFTNVSISR